MRLGGGDRTLPCCLSSWENVLGGEREGCIMIRKGIKTASKAAAFRITTERHKNYIKILKNFYKMFH